MKHQALLLLGPTGSGKTPLGERLERRSLRGRRCHHFDFGASLRAVVAEHNATDIDTRGKSSFLKRGVIPGSAGVPPASRKQTGEMRRRDASAPRFMDRGSFTSDEIRFLRRVLEEGALLEAEQFPLASRILEAFMARRNVQATDLLLLNGLPRHVAQAKAVDGKVKVIGVVQLDCDAPTVAERLRHDSGGDRGQRHDDTETLVARKLAIYEERTRPLLHHYRGLGVPVLNISVAVQTRPAEILNRLEAWMNRVYP
jgi:adenylate kinase